MTCGIVSKLSFLGHSGRQIWMQDVQPGANSVTHQEFSRSASSSCMRSCPITQKKKRANFSAWVPGSSFMVFIDSLKILTARSTSPLEAGW